MHSPQLAQAAHSRAVTHASGSDGGPQADPPLVTSWTVLTHAPGLLAVVLVVALAVPLPLVLFLSPLFVSLLDLIEGLTAVAVAVGLCWLEY